MIQIAIVDDNPAFHDYLSRIIQKHLVFAEIEYRISTFSSAPAYLEQLSGHFFEIAILDIELPEMDGITLSKKTQEISENTIIIFITSYSRYVKDAFGWNVFNYILKEECSLRLPDTLDQIIRRLNTRKETFVFKADQGPVRVAISDIIFVETQFDRTLSLTTRKRKYTIRSLSLSKLFNALNSPQMCQPNSHYIVNMDYVGEIRKGTITVFGLRSPIAISHGKYKEIYNQYLNYLAEKEQ